ncbi:MAG TPA: hypothetical protein VN436_01930, partial [Holophaga sp.]|nr:hypothetical protein [Holophaga sp.]
QDLPGNPFPKGRDWQEAERVRGVLKAAPAQWRARLKGADLRLAGSYLALWRWGQRQVRRGAMGKELRIAWEDRLLEPRSPQIVRGYALRHALCFALAEADAGRFGSLKDRLGEAIPDYFVQFQNAFSLLGAPAPVVRLWRLPAMEAVEVSLAQLGGRQLRIESDPGTGLLDLPEGTAWVVPTLEGSQPPGASSLEGASLEEARRLVPRLEAAGRTAYLAPVQGDLALYALMYFPIRIDLDAEGLVLRILMGDAALAKP